MRIDDLHLLRVCPLHEHRRISAVDFRAKNWRCSMYSVGDGMNGPQIRHQESELSEVVVHGQA
jgi:hypothetical protein